MTPVVMHDGSRVLLSRMASSYDPRDRAGAFRVLLEHQAAGTIPTGLLYLDETGATPGKAIGFQFIPYFGHYWIFFSSLRLADRLNFQLKLRGRRERAPKGLLIGACVHLTTSRPSAQW